MSQFAYADQHRISSSCDLRSSLVHVPTKRDLPVYVVNPLRVVPIPSYASERESSVGTSSIEIVH